MGDNEETVVDVDQIVIEPVSKQEPQKRLRKRSKALYPIPPRDVAVNRYFKVMQALNVASSQGKEFVKYDVVAPLAGFNAAAVSSILKFLSDVGFLERENKMYRPTSETIDYLNELEWNEPNSGKYLKPILIHTWFGEKTVTFLNVQKEVEIEDLIQFLGKQAHAEKSDHNSLSKLIDLLIYGDIINFDETSGKYSLINDIKHRKSEQSVETMADHEQKESYNEPKEENSNSSVNFIPAKTQNATKVNYNFNFNLKIDNVEDIEVVLNKIREFQQETEYKE